MIPQVFLCPIKFANLRDIAQVRFRGGGGVTWSKKGVIIWKKMNNMVADQPQIYGTALWLNHGHNSCQHGLHQPARSCQDCVQKKWPSRYCLAIKNWPRTRLNGTPPINLERLAQPSTKNDVTMTLHNAHHEIKHGGARMTVKLTTSQFLPSRDTPGIRAELRNKCACLEILRMLKIFRFNCRMREKLKKKLESEIRSNPDRHCSSHH